MSEDHQERGSLRTLGLIVVGCFVVEAIVALLLVYWRIKAPF